MNKTTYLLFILMISYIASYGQEKQTSDIRQLWAGYFNQTRFAGNWGTWVDLHLRTREEFVQNLSQAIARVGVTYYISDNTKITAGYAFINHYPADNHKGVSQPEHRPWQQIQWHTKYSRMRTMQWVRLEERLRRKILNDSTLENSNSFNYRLRYNFFLDVPISKSAVSPAFSFIVNDEVHINFGEEIVYNYFDQNRFFIGFAYHLNKHNNFQFGYMNVFQQLAAGNKYKNLHTLRLFYFQNLDVRKK